MYGHSTDTDITSTNYLMKIGVVGIIILSIISFSRETTISELITSVIGIILSIKIVSYNTEKLKEIYYQNNNNLYFSSHYLIFTSILLSLTPSNNNISFSSHIQIIHFISPSNHYTSLLHLTLYFKLNPYSIYYLFFIGSTYDIAQMKSKHDIGKSAADNFASQITIESVAIQEKGCDKIKYKLKKNLNIRIFKRKKL